MAFSKEEQAIIDWSIQNGKSVPEMKAAVNRFRTTGSPRDPNKLVVAPTVVEPESAPSFVERAGDVIAGAGERAQEAISGEGEFAGRSDIRRGAEAAATVATAVPKVAVEALPEMARTGLSKFGEAFGNLINKVGDTIGNIPGFAKWTQTHPDAAKALEEVAGTGAAVGEVAGDILLAQGAATGLQKGAGVTKSVAIKAGEGAVSKLDSFLSETTRATLDTGTQGLSKLKTWAQDPIKANVTTVLKEIRVDKFDDYVNTAKNAAQNNKNITPLEQAGKRAGEALNQIDRKLNNIGSNKSAVLEGATGSKKVGNIVVKFRQRLETALSKKTSVEGDKKVFRDVLSEAKKLGDNPTALQVDRFVDFVQDRIYTGKRDLTLPITDHVQKTLRPITGELNTSLKAQLPESYSTLNQQYSDMVGIRGELNLKLGKGGEKGGALMKRVFSPSDANTKQLFADVLDITGIDLVNEATIARYVMDVLGDARQKSMLEQLNISATKPSASGVINRLIDYGFEKLNAPEEIIRRARELTDGGGPVAP